MTPNIYERYVTLTGRCPYRLEDVTKFEHGPRSLTSSTIHLLTLHSGSVLIVQGDKILCFEYLPVFSFRVWLEKLFSRLRRGR